jgi:hypothetical protein
MPSTGPLVYDHEHKTATGESYRRNWTGGVKDIEALCMHHETVEVMRKNGQPQPLGPQSSLCQNCVHAADLSQCPFLAARDEIAGEPAIRLHLNSLPPSGDLAIIDEAGVLLETSRELVIDRDDLRHEVTFVKNVKKYQMAGYALDPILTMLDGQLYKLMVAAEDKHHGLTHKAVMEHLDPVALIEQAAAIRGESVEAYKAQLEGWLDDAQKCLQPNIHHYLAKSYADPALRAEHISTVTSAALMPHLLRVLLLGELGDISVNHDKKIVLTLPDYRHAELLKGYKSIIALDATWNIPDLARATQTEEEEWCEVTWGNARFDNTEINLVGGFGACGQNRRNDGEFSLLPRLVKFVAHRAAESREQDGEDMGLLELNRFLREGHYNNIAGVKPGAHFRDSRGSNEFKGMSNLVIVNANAKINLHSAMTQWHLQRGEAPTLEDASPEFHEWSNQKGRENMLQAVGRCRAQHFPGKKFRIDLVGNYDQDDINALARMYEGAKIKRVHVSEICIEAAPKSIYGMQRTIDALQEAFRLGEFNQGWIAAKLDIHVSTVSRYISKMFGTGFWHDLTRIFRLLHKTLNSETQISEEEKASLPEAVEFLQKFLPALASEIREKLRPASDIAVELVETVTAVGDEAFAQCLKLLSYSDVIELFCSIISLVHPTDIEAMGRMDAKKLLHPEPPKLRTA